MTLSELASSLKRLQESRWLSATQMAEEMWINFQSLLKLYHGLIKTQSWANYKAMVDYYVKHTQWIKKTDTISEPKKEVPKNSVMSNRPFKDIPWNLGQEFVKNMLENPEEIAIPQDSTIDTVYTYQWTRLVNLLDHFVQYLWQNHDGSYRIITLKPSTKPIRTLYHREHDSTIKTTAWSVQINKWTVKTVIWLPDKQEDVLYVVNKVTCFEHPTREDLIIPDECMTVWDKIICNTSFMINPYLYHLKDNWWYCQ